MVKKRIENTEELQNMVKNLQKVKTDMSLAVDVQKKKKAKYWYCWYW